MPRCNLTLKQKCQIIELSGDLSTEQLAKKFHVHPTTVTRTVKNKDKILNQASRVNANFKTVQTNQRGEEHDTMILEYIKARQATNEPLTIKEICDKAVECAKTLDRNIKSKRGWWRRFKVRCNIIRSRLQKATPGPRNNDSAAKEKDKDKEKGKDKASERKAKRAAAKQGKKKNYTFKVRDSGVHTASNTTTNGSQTITKTTITTTTNDSTPDTDNNDPETIEIDANATTPIDIDEKPQLPDVYEAMA